VFTLDRKGNMQQSYRVRKNRQFQYIYRKGKSTACREMVLIYVKASKLQAGFSVSKKVGNAVIRNKVKRRIRECFRLQMHELREGYYVFSARPAAADADYQALRRAMSVLLRQQKLYKGAS
jgi:ribonuclease P protein component